MATSRLPSPLVLSGYQPDFSSSVNNRDLETSTSDDVGQHYMLESSAVGYSILKGPY